MGKQREAISSDSLDVRAGKNGVKKILTCFSRTPLFASHSACPVRHLKYESCPVRRTNRQLPERTECTNSGSGCAGYSGPDFTFGTEPRVNGRSALSAAQF